ncbi:hypothetical protein [Desulfovibrio inopinatus]|uniref:hypothetical protein n=1 Tax=Desulfovibrio inopinatus TaxID=102109 RepID=UPI000409EC27|nr:hypothetical protein [Desulfovibrio inopinatus]
MQKKITTIALQDTEIAHNMYDSPVTIATIFEGTPPVDFLNDRAQQILSANPWLASRLEVDEQTGTPCLVHAEEPPLSPFYEQVDVADICVTGTTVDSILAETYTMPLSYSLSQIFTKHGFNSLNTDEPLFKIRLCTGSDGRFMIIVSMSHILGDGFTIYRIYQMLNPSEAVISLMPERIKSFHAVIEATGGLPGSLWIPRSGVVPSSNSKLNWLLESKALWCTKETREAIGLTHGEEEDVPAKETPFSGGLFQVNLERVAEQKRTFQRNASIPWISTNDILTSWFLTRSQASMGAIAINARDRTPEIGTRHAGNYQLGFLLCPEEFEDPAGIRASVKAFSASTKSGCTAGPGNTLALISSWTQRYSDLHFGTGCRLLLHLPLAPARLAPPVLLDSIMILFCSGNGGLAVALRSTNLTNFLDQTALGGPLLG